MAATYPAIQLPAPGGEIIRKDLDALIRRFLHVNQKHLHTLYARLQPSQRDCLEVLPLLFHCHHPALPGYGQGQAPFGVSAYVLTRTVREAIHRLALGFDYRRQGGWLHPILGLFLIGTAAGFTHVDASELQVWIFHRSDLEEEALAALTAKSEEINRWLQEHGLKVRCCLLDPARFRQGGLIENVGDFRCALFREKFYRAAIYLAGSKPLWWLVPPEHEDRYCEYSNYLIAKRFIDPDAILDLGGLTDVSAEEFARAGLWQLEQALNSPQQALPELMLWLDYAAAYPHPRWLATAIKQAVYAGQLEEAYDRLGLSLQINQALTHREPRPTTLNRVDFILQAGFKSIEQALEAWQILAQTLEHGFDCLRRFVLEHGVAEATNESLELLTRKLQAILARRPTKVDIIKLLPPAGLPEASLTLAQDSDGTWRLYANRLAEAGPIYQAPHLVQILVWAQANGVDRPGCRWSLHPGPLPLTLSELGFLRQATGRFLAHCPQPPLEVYRQPARLEAVALFLNIASSARPQRSGLEIASARFDPLGYGAERWVTIHGVEVLSYNSWGEIEVRHYCGLEGLLDSLGYLCGQSGPKTAVQVYCFSSRTVAQRVVELYQELAQTVSSTSAAWFVLGAGGKLYLFHSQNGHLSWWPCEDEEALTEALGQPRLEFAEVVFDRQTLPDSPLPFLYRHNQPGTVQAFFRPYSDGVEVLVIDERGALYRQRHAGAPPQAVLRRYADLLQVLAKRCSGKKAEFAWLEPAAGGWRVTPISAIPPAQESVRVCLYVREVPGSLPAFTLVCNDRTFSSLEWGDQVFAEAARYIHSFRRADKAYPYYLNDLDVPARVLGLTDPALVHTTCLLAYQRKLQQRLNLWTG